jgi:hypothetical protein
MLATQSAQVGMLDAAVLVTPLPEGSFYALLAETVIGSSLSEFMALLPIRPDERYFVVHLRAAVLALSA